MKKIVPVILLLIICSSVTAQDTLPKFTVRNIGSNKIVISWVNPFKNIRQVSIQRSFDSLKDFKTIVTVPDPTVPENGFLDTKAASDRMFYRLYIMLEKGVFLFSPTKRPVFDSTAIRKKILDSIEAKKRVIANGRMDKIPGTDSVSMQGPNPTLKEKEKMNVFMASKYVYTMEDGYVRINLPEGTKKYSIKFFDEKDVQVFEIKEIPLKSFKIDKSNFYHSGWFRFELYEDGKLFEKHKFLIPKEF
jgi:hypothetical protein